METSHELNIQIRSPGLFYLGRISYISIVKKQITTQIYSSPLGPLILGSFENKLCLCDWLHRKNRETIDNRLTRFLSAEYTTNPSLITEQAQEQLNEYFQGQRQSFTLPLLLAGSDFQKKVWQGLLRLNYGETKSYSSLACDIGHPEAVRAVAAATGANALSLFIPCHRIIGKNRKLTGYAGGLDAKKWLLGREQN